MSLITLSSGDDLKPYLFSSYFPQPIKIPTGSQVCLLKFIHFRDEDTFLVNNLNNRLFFCIGNTKTDGKRQVELDEGSYTGAELATEIQTKMNKALQQQNYSWTVSYSTVNDEFSISYASVATPASAGGTWTDYVSNDAYLQITNNDTAGQLSLIEPKLTGIASDPDSVSAFMRKGILVHLGTYETANIGFRWDDEMSDLTTSIMTAKFNDTTLGLVRDVISVPYPTQPSSNAGFKPTRQDIRIDLNETGEVIIYTIDNTKQTDPTKPNYSNTRLMRTIPRIAMDAITQITMSDKSAVAKSRLKVVMTLVGGVNNSIQVVAQMSASTDRGNTYAACTTSELDPSGNAYFRQYTRADGTVMDGVFWVSNEANFNDDGKQKAQILITKRCPYIPTLTSYDDAYQYGVPDLLSGDSTNWDGAEPYTCTAYTGANDFDFVFTSTSFTYYVKSPSDAIGSDNLKFQWSATDSGSPTLADMIYHPDTGDLLRKDTVDESFVYQGTTRTPEFSQIFPKYQVSGIFNGEERPVALEESKRTSTHQRFQIADADLGSGTGSQVAGDLSQKAILYLKKLSPQDVVKNSGTPAFLKQGEESGNIGLLIGSLNNIVITPSAATAQNVFTSNATPNKTAKATTLHVSIPELPVKSYEGGYNGIGKNIAVLPREEFRSQGSDSGRLVYVSDFENWLDIESATDLYINQFSVEVRNPDGSLATDLTPDTTLQIKLREDPNKVQKELSMMLKNSFQRTGQILSQDIFNVSS